MTKHSADFEFGENWGDYVSNYVDDRRIRIAKESLTDFFELSTFDGKTFVDVGCGSGLFSYAAYELGADKIVSFDLDQDVVSAAQQLRTRAGNPDNWEIMQGNILDEDFAAELGTYNLVYSWGVLHHTGAMFEAIENALDLLQSGGLFYLAVANDGRKGGLSSETWRKIKVTYNKSPAIGKRLLEAWYIGGFALYHVFNMNNPIDRIRNFEENWRGMAFYPDVKDWLGALPFEFASPEEIERCLESHDNQFTLEKLGRPEVGTGCNEFLIERFE